MVSLALTKDGTASKLADNLNKVYFHSENKGDVYLTSKDGWAKLAYALKAINPVLLKIVSVSVSQLMKHITLWMQLQQQEFQLSRLWATLLLRQMVLA